VSRATYANLFNAIGTTWGAGDGTTTFNVPDLRGRVPLSRGQGSGLTNRTLGSTGGAETHTLVTAEIPAHTHPATMTGFYGAGAVAWTAGPYAAGQLASGSTGGGGAHANMQPWSCVSWCVKV
jgi:microcystin-dependent protein